MKQFSTLFLFLFTVIHLYGYNEIWVGDVRNSWYTEQGVISKYHLYVQPEGDYAKCELILEFDASMLSFNPMDSLELEMNFELPEGAIVSDLWLWIFGQAERADIHDRWTASLIYESIVQRRIDPAILTINWGNTFNLKVFPIMTDMPRKVKIEYIVPITQGANYQKNIPIPYNLVQMSALEPERIYVYFDGSGTHSEPKICELPNTNFIEINHPEYGYVEAAKLDSNYESSQLTLGYTDLSPSKLSVYYDEDMDENFFNLSIKPSDFFDIQGEKKTVFLIDFIDQYSDVSGYELINQLKSTLLQNFSETDSFNIMFSGIMTAKAKNEWIACSESNISKIFDNISPEFFNSYSNLPPLIRDGVEFVKTNGNDGNIVVISSGQEHGDREAANGLITDILGLMEHSAIPIHVIDLNTQYEGYYIGGVYYTGNEYLYKHLTQKTGGEYEQYRYLNSLTELFSQTCSRLSGFFKNISIDIEFENGYTYSEFDINKTNSIIYYDEEIRRAGKYIGNYPVTIKGYAQKASGEVVQESVILYDGHIQEECYSLKYVWASYLIGELKTLPQTNMMMTSIIETSIDYRVLCDYTAFLVLEPGFVPDIDPYNGEEMMDDDWGWATSLSEMEREANKYLSNYPNPVETHTTIKYYIEEAGNAELILYNSSGEMVRVLADKEMTTGHYELILDASDLTEGIYFYVLKLNNALVQQNKLIVIK